MVPSLQDSLLFRSFGRLHRPAVVPAPTETPRRRKNLVLPVVSGAFFVVLAIINVSFTQDIQQTLFRLFFLHFFSCGGLHTPSTPIYFAPGNQRQGLILRVLLFVGAPNVTLRPMQYGA